MQPRQAGYLGHQPGLPDARAARDQRKARAAGGGGPPQILEQTQLPRPADERCGGEFDNIDDVVSPAERNDFMAKYKAAAGFAIEQLNNAPPTIASGLRVSSAVGA